MSRPWFDVREVTGRPNAGVVEGLYREARARERGHLVPDHVALDPEDQAVLLRAVAGLLEVHDDTGIDLYQWDPVLRLVERVSGHRVKATDSTEHPFD